MLKITLYTQSGCHLCDAVVTQLALLQTAYPHQLIEFDITTDPEIHQRYCLEIPVLVTGDLTLQAPISLGKLRRFLKRATQSTTQS